jgi:hypothetical protein
LNDIFGSGSEFWIAYSTRPSDFRMKILKGCFSIHPHQILAEKEIFLKRIKKSELRIKYYNQTRGAVPKNSLYKQKRPLSDL